MRPSMPTYMPTYRPTYIHAYIHAYIYIHTYYMPTCLYHTPPAHHVPVWSAGSGKGQGGKMITTQACQAMEEEAWERRRGAHAAPGRSPSRNPNWDHCARHLQHDGGALLVHAGLWTHIRDRPGYTTAASPHTHAYKHIHTCMQT